LTSALHIALADVCQVYWTWLLSLVYYMNYLLYLYSWEYNDSEANRGYNLTLLEMCPPVSIFIIMLLNSASIIASQFYLHLGVGVTG